ncbi:Dipeptidyl aminopeptidase/acylaminoacyl peptidase [Pseudarcicella hirudinis]|uniref:Dipeptidyl aminopeptidase/acylaminoacyl peptidase n=1 Tax=Pseudarcicella hirudinis TaxID=1079859 RepID=A0A1I5WC29_9BACT|nr:prolyl oligopeptidase family serine peptidase [Pseudarcicella hirudinis]SFQ17282.1 Dipeptidyl aminopeptidase/acylaminoacyl peptidase [Pseudarcicella hirudinis]
MRKLFTVFACLLLSTSLLAQKKKSKTNVQEPASAIAKKTLSHDVYDNWKEIPDKLISNDGQSVVYTLNPQEGDGKVMIYSLKNQKTDSVSRGYDLRLTDDSEYAVFKIKPQLNVVKALKRQKKKKEDLPKDSLAVYHLKSNALLKYPNVISYEIPEKSGGWVAFQVEEAKKTAEKQKDSTQKETKKKAAKKESETNGYRLVLRNLSGKTEQFFPFVTDYEFSKNGSRLVFSTTGNDSSFVSGVYSYELSTGKLENIFKSKGKFRKIGLSEDGLQTAFIADLDTNAKTQIRLPKLYLWKKGQETAQKLTDESQTFAPQGWLISDNYQPKFSKDGSKLFFGTNPKPVVPDTTLLPEEIVNVEVWNWQDKRLQPQQKVSLEDDRKKSYLAVVNLDNLQIIQLGSKEIPNVTLDKDANNNLLLATSEEPYSQEHWDWNARRDVYLLNLKDGSKKQIATALRGNPVLSPNANFVTWWALADTAWFAYSVKDNKTVKITDNRTVRFFEEDDDHPDFPQSYGAAGWTEDERSFIVYDRYDVWGIDPNGNKKILTNGRNTKVVYRVAKLDPEEKFAMKGTILFKIFDAVNKDEGFALAGKTPGAFPETVVKQAFSFSNPVKARNADKLIFTKMNFQNFPDLYTTDLSLKNISKISDANPQQKEYAWGSVELIDWKAQDGTPLQGLLYKPENFDPTKQYPLMVYYYEKNSDNLHTHFVPSPIRSYINYPYFTSNGYLIFVPDIVYKIGDPGKSAYNCLIPGVESLIARGFVKKDRIGISGHSWGGYQTAYLVTQTNIFRAAEAGAPVANMTSAYGGIRWESGLSRQAQYEHTQSRIGGNLWENTQKYLDNSPLFFAPKIQTPLLMMHNDDDGAVPWYQGIEYYMALKRLNKPVWLLNYNGEKHGLTLRKNRKDFAIRLYQYFDHYLKDAPAPLWMTQGLPMLEKGINQKLELDK